MHYSPLGKVELQEIRNLLITQTESEKFAKRPFHPFTPFQFFVHSLI